jgi:hypothetical protein
MRESKLVETKDNEINASPVKSFFVNMLTRDIALNDAILDLLDNCIDGIRRSSKCEGEKPYQGFWAEIEIRKDFFSISDNCGGIPWELHPYAFRMGRDQDRPVGVSRTVGTYGIGMKRAIFKIGKHCLITTRSGADEYEVEITPKWLKDEINWFLPTKHASGLMNTDGTKIVIKNLNEGISEFFDVDAENFISELRKSISAIYAYIIEKGFEVKINNKVVNPRTTKLSFDLGESAGIRPYIFETESDGVEVFLAVGFTREPPSENEINDEKKSAKYSSYDAGWTIICNDRTVVHCDRTELTGWGEANVPRYHNQFIAISGIVEFKSDDPRKLPTTTTKRGIDASSPLYLQVKNKMREGMKIFTEYTNKWKGLEDESKRQIKETAKQSFREIKIEAKNLPLKEISRSSPKGNYYKPNLPVPERPEPTTRRISFKKELVKIKKVGEYFGNSELDPNEVGIKCFDTIYEEVMK